MKNILPLVIVTIITIWCTATKDDSWNQQNIMTSTSYNSYTWVIVTWDTVGYFSWWSYYNKFFGIRLKDAVQWLYTSYIILRDRDWSSIKLCGIDEDGIVDYTYCISKFEKNPDQTITWSIIDLIQTQKDQSVDWVLNWLYPIIDPSRCIVTWWALSRSEISEIAQQIQTWMESYWVNLSSVYWDRDSLKNYTSQEQQIIQNSTWIWPFDSSWIIKTQIYNRKLQQYCWNFINVISISTSKSSQSTFIYNPSISTQHYYFLPLYYDPVPFSIFNIEILP